MAFTNKLVDTLQMDPKIAHVLSQPLAKVIVWCTNGTPHHWMSSYGFASKPVVNSAGKELAGISLNMYQPKEHTLNNAAKNLHGSLDMSTRLENLLYSQRAHVQYSITFTTTVTVQNIADLVVQQKRQYYKFAPEGSGCMYWQLQLLVAFASNGWITSTDVGAVAKAIQEFATKKNAKTPNEVPFPPIQGSFYDPQN